MTELQIYGRDGLFHSIIKQSRIMEGRYTVLTKGAHDLNMNNLLSGLDLPKEKYPCVCCLPPASEMASANDWQHISFRILFVCTAEGTGDNQVKYPDPITNASQVDPSKDWSDMKEVALSFMNALNKIQKSYLQDFRISQSDTWRFVRFAHMQNDNLNGIMLMFTLNIFDKCEYGDIDVRNVDTDLCKNEPETYFH